MNTPIGTKRNQALQIAENACSDFTEQLRDGKSKAKPLLHTLLNQKQEQREKGTSLAHFV